MYYSNLLGASRSDIGKPQLAHIGLLTEPEYQQIECERDRIARQF